MKPLNVTILGATGSIGISTLDVVALHPEKYSVFALTGHSRIIELTKLAVKYRPRYLVTSPEKFSNLKSLVSDAGLDCEVLAGTEALQMVAEHADVDVVMAAIVGAAGLLPTFAAVNAGKRVLLANKEALVMSGQLFMEAVAANQATLLPVDSEHNAIFQSLPNGCFSDKQVRKLLLTGSGGTFLHRDLATFSSITPEEACKHPNWSMGRKITVDSATMMNKGLEFIEACHIFSVAPEYIEVVIHPQSIVHSMVQYVDGSVIAQLGSPDMRTPIAHALSWPQRIESGVSSLDFAQLVDLQFLAPDYERFPCLKLAIDTVTEGQAATTALNAANEVAVEAFLNQGCRFTDIHPLCADVVEQISHRDITSLDDILSIDQESRLLARQYLKGLTL